MGFPKASLTAQGQIPQFENPQSIFDLLNFQLHEFLGISGSLVTRICENEYGITREAQDPLALASQHKAAAAQDAGRFKDEIVPFSIA